MDHNSLSLLVLLFSLIAAVISTLATSHADLAQKLNCDQVFDAWKPTLRLLNLNQVNKIGVQYKKPADGIDSLTISLLRSDAYVDCRVVLKERRRFVDKVIFVKKERFCLDDYCEEYFENLGFGYYCIQMEVHLVNDSDTFDVNSSCKIVNVNETLKMDPGQVNSTLALLVKAGRTDVAISSMSTTWIVVGSLVIVGVFLAFALDKMHRNHWKMHAYSSVATTKSPDVEMEVIATTMTTTANASSSSSSSSGQLRMAKEITGRLLVLYAYESHAQFILVKHLVDLLRQTLPNWEVVFYEEHSKKIDGNYEELVAWVQQAVYSVDRIIIVGSERARRLFLPLNTNIGHGDVNSVFSIAWSCILNDDKLRGNHTKIFNVRFENGDLGRDRASINVMVPGLHFVLPIDYLRLINHVLGNNLLAETFCRDLKTRLDEFHPYQLLEAAVEWMSTDAAVRGPHRHAITPPPGRSHDLSWILNG